MPKITHCYQWLVTEMLLLQLTEQSQRRVCFLSGISDGKIGPVCEQCQKRWAERAPQSLKSLQFSQLSNFQLVESWRQVTSRNCTCRCYSNHPCCWVTCWSNASGVSDNTLQSLSKHSSVILLPFVIAIQDHFSISQWKFRIDSKFGSALY